MLFCPKQYRVSLITLLFFALIPLSLRAEILLTVNRLNADVVTYTQDELTKLPSVTIETTTPWTDGLQEFTGVALYTILGDTSPSAVLTLRAINDYSVTIPAVDISSTIPVIAFERNGSLMSVRNKGPLWLIYPFDSETEFQTETAFSRSIWQLVEITVGH